MFFINFVVNNNIISVFLPLSALVYAMIDTPIPHLGYWKFMTMYMLVVIALKFIYQLPIFCGTPPYHFFSVDTCTDSTILSEILVTRVDYIIGIHKFSGSASYPVD
jgi:hypothetical protein